MQASVDANSAIVENLAQAERTIQRITHDEPVAEIDETRASSQARWLQEMVQERIRSHPQEINMGVMRMN